MGVVGAADGFWWPGRGCVATSSAGEEKSCVPFYLFISLLMPPPIALTSLWGRHRP